MADVIVIGGGLAGLASAAALAGAGHTVRVLEARRFLGGRATSYEIGTGENAETIDNCQHILLRCCVNLLDFYRRLGVEDQITFYRDFIFIEPGGQRSVLRSGLLPPPAHFLESFLSLKFLNLAEKMAVMRGIRAIQSQYQRRTDLDRITMLDWLQEQRQPPRAIERFWRQIMVSAISEELGATAASHGFQVFRLGLLGSGDSYQMGVPTVPLGEFYGVEKWKNVGPVEFQLRSAVERIVIERGAVTSVITRGEELRADQYICALPFERVAEVAPDLDLDISGFEYAPITGIHLWFDRPVIDVPQATLLDRTIQWIFNKQEGRAVQLVVSASRGLLEMPRADVIALAIRELEEFLPEARGAKLEKAHVVKEVRAVLSAKPGMESRRPPARTKVRNLFLAGDWTRSGWPAIMEGAVRSGYLAAEAVADAAGDPRQFLLTDIA
jgi:squalene-associated FAD-dependent desaturase